MSSYSISDVFKVLRQHLLNHSSQLKCFVRYEFQDEGWLKAEWIAVLDELRNRNHIYKLDREVKIKGKKMIDLTLDLDDGRHWIELKHWFIEKQKGYLWRPTDSIYDLENECKKFISVKGNGQTWIAALCSPNPRPHAWLTAIRQFNQYYTRWRLRIIDNPKSYPDYYFLDLLQVLVV